MVNFWLKSVFLKYRQKRVFLTQNNFEQRLKKIVMDKNLQKNSKAIQIHVFKNSFLTFLINFMFLTFFYIFLPKKKKKKKKSDFLARESLKSFLSFFGQNSDNLDRFLVKFHSKLNIFIIPYYFNSQVMATTIFTKSYQIAPTSPQ